MTTASHRDRSGTGRSAAMEEIVAELRHLRALVREAGESYIFRREGEIESIISQLETIPTPLLKRETPGWLDEIRDLKIKPAKGRLKDLKGVDELLDVLARQLSSAQEWGMGSGT